MIRRLLSRVLHRAVRHGGVPGLSLDLTAVTTALESRIAEASERYRQGHDCGGARELSAASSWTHHGWVLDRRVP